MPAKSLAYEQGRNAFVEGGRRGHNPYSAGGSVEKAYQWWKGWDDEELEHSVLMVCSFCHREFLVLETEVDECQHRDKDNDEIILCVTCEQEGAGYREESEEQP